MEDRNHHIPLSPDAPESFPRNHQKLVVSDLDIDHATLGSFIYIPSEENHNKAPSHEVVRLGNTLESVLILTDYKKASPGQSSAETVEPILISSKMDQGTSEKSYILVESSSSSENESSSPLSKDTLEPIVIPDSPKESNLPKNPPTQEINPKYLRHEELQYLINCPLIEVYPGSSIRILLGLTNDSYEILESQSQVSTMADLAALPEEKPTAYEFMKEVGVPPDVSHLVSIASQILVHSKALRAASQPVPVIPSLAVSVPVSEFEKPSIDTKNQHDVDGAAIANTVVASVPGRPDRSPEAEPLKSSNIRDQPVTIMEEILVGDAHKFLEAHAFIHTIGQLADFPSQFPGMFQVLKDSRALPGLDGFVMAAQLLCKMHQSSVGN